MPKQRKVDPFNLALATFLEWGPASAIDIKVRIHKKLPKLSRAEVGTLLSEFATLQSAACRIVEEQVEKHQTEEDGRRRVAELDGRISSDNASKLYSQARYSAWRDGYR